MAPLAAARLWGASHAFDQPATAWIVGGIAFVLVAAIAIIAVLGRLRLVAAPLRRELWLRTLSWVGIVLIVIVPVLLGAFWTMLLVCGLGLACFSEYARATGLFRERTISACVVLGILVLTFAELDHWHNFFMALFPLASASSPWRRSRAIGRATISSARRWAPSASCCSAARSAIWATSPMTGATGRCC